MRKPVIFLWAIIATLTAGIIYVWPYLVMELTDSAHYTESNKREYAFFTPDVLKAMPRISQRFDFLFVNISGPAKHIHVINFYNAEDISLISKYLEQAGYRRQEKCDPQPSLCWRNADPQETIYVGSLRGEKTVIVQVVYDFT